MLITKQYNVANSCFKNNLLTVLSIYYVSFLYFYEVSRGE